MELVDDNATFFAPVSSDLVDGLVGQYDNMRARIEAIASRMADADTHAALHYFLEGNSDKDRKYSSATVDTLFALPDAIGALNAAYWSKALQLTDVLDTMPQKRRDEWNQQIMNPLGTKRDKYAKDWIIPPLPDFTDGNVRDTLGDLLRMRGQFLAERVDGIFRGLSGEHVTNAPEAFGKRMIIAYVLNDYYTTNHGRAGLINDLRAVIAKFMGRDEPRWNVTSGLIDALKNRWGEWVTVDGGALRIRLYKKGTAHLEVHPDMAWRLNCVLAQMHPLAIPAEFRQKPRKRAKEIAVMQRPLPFAVLEALSGFKFERNNPRRLSAGYAYQSEDKHAKAEACRILESIGGAQVSPGVFEFDYDTREVLADIITSGCVPDHKSHQYYPTPEKLARIAVEAAGIDHMHTVLEPSAGQGGLADIISEYSKAINCVELSALHCKVLEAKGYRVTQADFLALHTNRELYDRVVMNPPFDQGRWQAHLQHAADMTKPGGKLVAILPSSAKSRDLLPGWTLEWQGPFDNEFVGASVSVVLLIADKP
jgi:Domain of unknown function (DUF4942)